MRCWGEEGWGVEGRREEEEEGVRDVRTRSRGDRSPGSPSVWQLWKFIAIDFVISSLSIGSTRAHWWIVRKLFLQSCFFLSLPLLRGLQNHVPAISCPFFSSPICWDVPLSLNVQLFFPAAQHSSTWLISGWTLRCGCAFRCETEGKILLPPQCRRDQINKRSLRSSIISVSPVLTQPLSPATYFIPPLWIRKTVRVRNVSRFWEYGRSSQWIWGRSLKSVLPFIVPRGKICTAKVRWVRQPMTCRPWSARHRLTSERSATLDCPWERLGDRNGRKRREREGSAVTWCTIGSVKTTAL